jgi:GMP synthase (glutamine-hydrolysing)
VSRERVLVVANGGDAHPGYVGERFEQRGFTLETVLRDGGVLPARPAADVRAVVLLGSDWSVATPVDEAALAAECALVHGAADAGVPVLGLCYGAQVVAHAHGGRVRAADVPEVGLISVESRDESFIPAGPWWAFHGDVIDLPPTAELIADNTCGVQAFVLPGALAVQFHPEVVPETLDDWLGRFPAFLEVAGGDHPGLVGQARRLERDSRAAAHALVDSFLERFAAATAR